MFHLSSSQSFASLSRVALTAAAALSCSGAALAEPVGYAPFGQPVQHGPVLRDSGLMADPQDPASPGSTQTTPAPPSARGLETRRASNNGRSPWLTS